MLGKLKQGLCINVEGWNGAGNGTVVQNWGDICMPKAAGCYWLPLHIVKCDLPPVVFQYRHVHLVNVPISAYNTKFWQTFIFYFYVNRQCITNFQHPSESSCTLARVLVSTFKAMDLENGFTLADLGSNFSSTTYQLCDLRKTQSHKILFFSSVKWRC